MGTSPSPAPKRMEAALQGAEDVQPGMVWVPKTNPGALLSLAPLTPRKLPMSSAVARSWGRSLPWCPVPVGACTHLYGEVLVQERYSGLSAVGRGAMGCSMAASWL